MIGDYMINHDSSVPLYLQLELEKSIYHKLGLDESAFQSEGSSTILYKENCGNSSELSFPL